MVVLGINTSTQTGGAALINEQGLLGEYVLNIRSTHSERLMPAIERVLTDADLTVSQLDAIAVVTGPGSFTGLRIGVTTAKGFGYALATKIIGVTTLAALAWQCKFFPGVVCSLVDARRQQVYAQLFRNGTPLCEPVNDNLDHVIDLCHRHAEPVLFVGDGAALYHEQISDRLHQAAFPESVGNLLHASSVAALGYSRLLLGECDDPLTLAPFYMRKSEAEIKWAKNN